MVEIPKSASKRFWILPFADTAMAAVPLKRILRLSLFQISIGLVSVLLIGALNRVMIVELQVPASIVGIMVAIPVIAAPLRVIIGSKSDSHKSAIGWRRVPYIWLGTMIMFSGLAMMPFALILLSGDHQGPEFAGPVAAAISFFLCGLGMHTVQTVGVALATDLVPSNEHPRVVSLLCFMSLIGMMIGSIAFSLALTDYSEIRLIQLIQTVAVLSLLLNLIALWKQEARVSDPSPDSKAPSLAIRWNEMRQAPGWTRRLAAVGIGSSAFAMQDILLEPFGGQILGLSVGHTTLLSAVFALGGIVSFYVAAQRIGNGYDTHRLAAHGSIFGIFGFLIIVCAAPIKSAIILGFGTLVVGYGSGLFLVSMLSACVSACRDRQQTGLGLGVWGAVQATSGGAAVACGSIIRDIFSNSSQQTILDGAQNDLFLGYAVVYLLEIFLLFVTLVVLGPLVKPSTFMRDHHNNRSSLNIQHMASMKESNP